MGIMNWNKVKKDFDKVWMGVVFGVVFSVIGFFLAKFVKDKQGSYTVEAFWNLMVGQTDYYLEILTFSLLPNMLAFYFLFFRWQMDKAVRGLIFATIMLMGMVFLLH
jgi:ABC-type bacteriocin/lantibiotic exporter with double-glycine peptidase domain